MFLSSTEGEHLRFSSDVRLQTGEMVRLRDERTSQDESQPGNMFGRLLVMFCAWRRSFSRHRHPSGGSAGSVFNLTHRPPDWRFQDRVKAARRGLALAARRYRALGLEPEHSPPWVPSWPPFDGPVETFHMSHLKVGI